MVSMTFLFYSWKEDVSTNRNGKGRGQRSEAVPLMIFASNSDKRRNFVLKANIKVKNLIINI
jgi:hypothetical protein